MKQFYANEHAMPIPDDIMTRPVDWSQSNDASSNCLDIIPLSLATPYLCPVYAQGSHNVETRMVQQRHKDEPRIIQEWHKDDPTITQQIKSKLLEEFPKTSRRIRDVFVGLLYRSGTRSVPLMYGECTVDVLKRYYECTTEVLPKYYRGTKHVPAACTSTVGLGRGDRGGIVRRPTLYLLLTVFVLCLLDSAQAQSPAPAGTAAGQNEIKPLQIGDTIPEELWHLPLQVVNHPEGKDTITLNDFRDKKLIILDFWATWCGPCIRSLDKLDSIQPLFGDDLQIVPVTKQSKDIVAPFLKGRAWRHLSTYGTSDLSQYFPHGTIPHQIWIRDNNILALTGSEYTEDSFIRDVLSGGNPFLFMKNEDLAFDPKVPLFARMVDDAPQWQDRIGTFSILTTHQPDLPFAREWWDGSSWMLTNLTIPALYARAFADSIPQVDYRRRLIVEVDSVKEYVLPPQHAEKHSRKFWFSANTYCYNASMAPYTDKTVYRKRLMSELNDFFGNRYGIQGGVEKRQVDLLELSVADMTVFLASSRAVHKNIYHRASVQGDVILYEDIDTKNLGSRITQIDRRSNIPVIDAVSSARVFTVSFPKGGDPLSNLEAWNVGLAKVGLRLVHKTDYLDMLVIRSLNNQ